MNKKELSIEEQLKIDIEEAIYYNIHFSASHCIDPCIKIAKKYADIKVKHDLERLYHWLISEKKECASTKFTAKYLRNIAREIEYKIKNNE